jgi:hypothetical protein
VSVASRVTNDEQHVAALTALLGTGKLPIDVYDGARREALAVATDLRDSELGPALRRLAPHLDGDVLDSAWSTAQRIRSKWHEVRAPALAALAPRFSGARRDDALHEALKAAFSTSRDNKVKYSLPALLVRRRASEREPEPAAR